MRRGSKGKPEPPFERVPPQNVDAERCVLGAMLLNPDAVGIAVEMLHENAEDLFYVEAHQHIYRAMLQLFRRNFPIDAVTLTDQLQKENQLEGIGGATYVSDLCNAVQTSANIQYYAQIVLDAAILRRLITACTLTAGEAYSTQGDVADILDRAEQQIFSIAEQRQLNPIYKVGDLLTDAIHRIEHILSSKTGYTGVPTGYAKFDEMLSGLQPSDMIVLAARPSVGKTAFSLNIASNIALRQKKAALIFSLEMAKEQLVMRMLCMEGKINSKRLRTGFLAGSEFPKLQAASDRLSQAPIYIDDTPGITILDIRSKARRHKAQHDLDLIIIDYMQLMSGSKKAESRQTEIAEISRSVKGLARELSVPVIALSQLSREAEKDDSGQPKLSHLRESGAIEQDADVVIMLSRPPAHKLPEISERFGEQNLEQIIEVIIAKQRNGPTGSVYMRFDKDLQRFGELALGGEEEAPETHTQMPEAEYAGSIDFDEEPPF
jgi:replicative DNA helicase